MEIKEPSVFFAIFTPRRSTIALAKGGGRWSDAYEIDMRAGEHAASRTADDVDADGR